MKIQEKLSLVNKETEENYNSKVTTYDYYFYNKHHSKEFDIEISFKSPLFMHFE